LESKAGLVGGERSQSERVLTASKNRRWLLKLYDKRLLMATRLAAFEAAWRPARGLDEYGLFDGPLAVRRGEGRSLALWEAGSASLSGSAGCVDHALRRRRGARAAVRGGTCAVARSGVSRDACVCGPGAAGGAGGGCVRCVRAWRRAPTPLRAPAWVVELQRGLGAKELASGSASWVLRRFQGGAF